MGLLGEDPHGHVLCEGASVHEGLLHRLQPLRHLLGCGLEVRVGGLGLLSGLGFRGFFQCWGLEGCFIVGLEGVHPGFGFRGFFQGWNLEFRAKGSFQPWRRELPRSGDVFSHQPPYEPSARVTHTPETLNLGSNPSWYHQPLWFRIGLHFDYSFWTRLNGS